MREETRVCYPLSSRAKRRTYVLGRAPMQRSFASLKVCDFFKIAKPGARRTAAANRVKNPTSLPVQLVSKTKSPAQWPGRFDET